MVEFTDVLSLLEWSGIGKEAALGVLGALLQQVIDMS